MYSLHELNKNISKIRQYTIIIYLFVYLIIYYLFLIITTISGFSEAKATGSATQESEHFKLENWFGKLGLWIVNALLKQTKGQGSPCIVPAFKGEKNPKHSAEVPAVYIKPHTETPYKQMFNQATKCPISAGAYAHFLW